MGASNGRSCGSCSPRAKPDNVDYHEEFQPTYPDFQPTYPDYIMEDIMTNKKDEIKEPSIELQKEPPIEKLQKDPEPEKQKLFFGKTEIEYIAEHHTEFNEIGKGTDLNGQTPRDFIDSDDD